MNLLLLLSALLSALTGGTVGGARVPVAAEQVAQAGLAAVRAAPARSVTLRPANKVAPITARLRTARVVALVVAEIPPFASRRRE